MAAKDFLLHTIASLETEFKREMPKEGKRRIWPDLVKETEAAVSAAYDHFVLNSPFLPSPAQFLAKVQNEGRNLAMAEAKQREEDHERQKPKRYESTFLTQEQKTEYGKRSALIMAMATPRNDQGMPIPVDRKRLEGLVEACEHMEACYPHVAEDWRGLKVYFAQKGLG